MNPRNRSFLLVLVGAGLTACVGGGAGAPPVDVETAPLDVSRTFDHVMKHVSETGEESYSAGLFCGNSHRHCKARIETDASGHPLIGPRAGGGSGVLGATDLQAAYGLDVTKTPNATVAIVDAYGYTGLESDLAKYRSMYGLPACTTANGCLKIVNQQGQTSPLPKSDGQGCNGWNGETSLDVDMASAACPNCKILVVLTDDADESMMPNLEMGQKTAAMLGATVISDSWGGADSDTNDIMMSDKYFDVSPAKTGIFVASGDDGWNNYEAAQQQGGMAGPDFPSTSEFVIAVGGTVLTKSTSSARGWTETAWADGGSSCSPVIATPTWMAGINTSCNFRAAVDVAADASPTSGSAVNTVCGGSSAGVGGTSAASPLVAAIFALYGHGENKGDFVYTNKAAWNDVTSGTNGSCGNIQCQAGTGWDGPTSLGTPNGKALGMIAPTDGNPNATPDMAMPPDMAMAPDMAQDNGNGGSGGSGGGGGTGTGGNGGSGGSGGGNGNHGGDSGCSMGGAAAATGGLWLFLVFGVAVLGRTLRFRRRA